MVCQSILLACVIWFSLEFSVNRLTQHTITGSLEQFTKQKKFYTSFQRYLDDAECLYVNNHPHWRKNEATAVYITPENVFCIMDYYPIRNFYGEIKSVELLMRSGSQHVIYGDVLNLYPIPGGFFKGQKKKLFYLPENSFHSDDFY